MGNVRRVACAMGWLLLATQLSGCAITAATGAEDTDTTHATSATTKEQYASYFSDSTYTPPTNADITDTFENSDPDFILPLLDKVELLTLATVLHGITLSFETCPASETWSGDYTRDLLVPQEYATIQAAIDVAVDYQSIIVDPSTPYEENLSIHNKFIHLFSSSSDPVMLTPKDASLPAILFHCSGGGMIGGFAVEGGTVGVKASASSLGMTTIVDSTFANITTPIVLIDTHFFLVDNVISGVTDGIFLGKATGSVHHNTIHGGAGIAIYLETPRGVVVSENQLTQNTAGQGAIFMNGGAAVVKQNTLALAENAFGLFSQYASAETGAGLEVVENTVASPKSLGVVVFGGTGNTTQAYLAGNTVTDTISAQGDENFAWLTNYGEGTAFIDGNGVIVADATANAINNTTTANVIIGLGYVRSCGTIAGNLSLDNGAYDIVAKAFSDDDTCAEPTLGTNTYGTILDNSDNNGGGEEELALPDEPMEVPALP